MITHCRHRRIATYLAVALPGAATLLSIAAPAVADAPALVEASVLANSGALRESIDASWVALAAMLVFFMQAGFALLESGMVRSKNAVNVMMKNYLDCCVASLLFWAIGYGLMFGASGTGWLGTSGFFIADGSARDFTTLLFQLMFASVAATICSGAMAERTRFPAYLIGTGLISGIIYPVFGSWVWNDNGWLKQLGFVDFAGSTVVHSIGAWCALAGILVLGPRIGRFSPDDGSARPIQGHNLSLVALGGFILWLGWFGFNAGSTLAANGHIGAIALNTHLAACAGALAAAFAIGFGNSQRVLLTSTVNGSIAGLVAITAGCATMSAPFALLTGAIGGALSVVGVRWLERAQLDDVVGAVAVHGFAGVWGTLAAGLFHSERLFDPALITVQLLGIAMCFLWTFPLAYAGYLLIDRWIGLRAPALDEMRGLDLSEHAEVGYPEFHARVSYRPEPARLS